MADVLAGKRFGVPRLYINADALAGTSYLHTAPGTGGQTGQRIVTRSTIVDLWQQAKSALVAAGAEIVDVDFPVVSSCEGDRPGAPTIATRGLVSPAFLHREIADLSAWA
jgi:amidase